MSQDLRNLQVRATQLAKAVEQRQKADPLFNFECHPKQQLFTDYVLGGEKIETWCFGGNRSGKCITPFSLVEMGSSTRPIVEVLGEGSFAVTSLADGTRCTRKASPVFLKGIETAYRVHLDNGQFFECSYTHRVLTNEGWAFLGDLLSNPNGQHCKGKYEDYQENCGKGAHQYDQQPRRGRDSDTTMPLQVSDAQRCIPLASLRMGVVVPTPECIRAYLASSPLSNLGDPDQILGLISVWQNCESDTTYSMSLGGSPVSGTPLFEKAPAQEEGLFHVPSQPYSGEIYPVCYVLPYAVPLFGDTRIIAYQNIGLQPIVDFTVEETHCYYAAGVVHHNSDVGSYAGAHLARFGLPEAFVKSQFAGGGAIEVRGS